MNVASLWLSVYESGTENGGMRVIPKTHNLELSVSGLRAEDFATDVGFAMHRASYDEAHAVDLCLNPGDISVHHPNTVHGSHANTSNRRRGGLTLRYISKREAPSPPIACVCMASVHSIWMMNGNVPWIQTKIHSVRLIVRCSVHGKAH